MTQLQTYGPVIVTLTSHFPGANVQKNLVVSQIVPNQGNITHAVYFSGVSMSKKRLFVVDAMALAFRSYHAFARALTTSDGMPTQAVYGSLLFLINLIEKERPDYLVIATDSREKTFRHQIYDLYKANRSEMPEDLAVQLPHLFRAYEALGCKLLKEPGLEADDLIGTLALQARQQDLLTYIVSGDKDFLQLIDEQTFLYSPKKGGEVSLANTQAVYDKFGILPSQVIDILALMGDSADNVPGVPGIGEKGATSLIQKYGSLEGVYENLDQVTNKRQWKSLQENRELAFLSKELVTIKTDADLAYAITDFYCQPDTVLLSDDLMALVEELEFRSIRSRLQKLRQATPAASASIQSYPHSYKSVVGDQDWSEFYLQWQAQDTFAFDTETTGLDIINDYPIGISISWQDSQAYYIPLNHQQTGDLAQIKQQIQERLTDTKTIKIAHNLKFDLQMLHNIGIQISGPIADTMLASYLLKPNERFHNLDICCTRYLGYKKISTQAVLGDSGTMVDTPLETLVTYACEDVDFTFQLFRLLVPQLEQQNLHTLFYQIEMPLVPIIAKMEQNGVFIDKNSLAKQASSINIKIQELESQIYEKAGETFNIKSPKQLQEILYEKLKVQEILGVKRLKKTKSGFSTDASVLEKLSAHPLVADLLEFRMLTKLKSTYIDTLPKLVNDASQRLHATFHQTGTATGRLSSSEPNLQNIPIRSPLGREIRKAFRPQSADNVIISADYSQIELRILASLADDPNLKAAFHEDLDIHTATASQIFTIAPHEVSHNQRNQAKAINFGIIYGMGPQRLARDTGVSQKEAKSFIERYFASYPKIRTFIDGSISFAKKHEYTLTLGKRKRPLPEINGTDRLALANAQNIAVNTPVQGSAADLIKLAMIKLDQQFARHSLHAKLLMQVHDELIWECPKNELEQVQKIIKESMETAMDIGVPLKITIGVGSNWLEAH